MPLRDTDRRQIRRELAVAICGILFGALTTLFNKIIESEYQHQHNLSVIEYQDDCRSAQGNPDAVMCTISLSAHAPRPIENLRLTVRAFGTQATEAFDMRVQPGVTIGEPYFAPPEIQTEQDVTDPSFAAIYIDRLRDGQKVIWRLMITSTEPIDVKSQIHPEVTTNDKSARIEEGTA
jgi:hypothetical protein